MGGGGPFSRVLMNPPFKLSSNSETEFVDYALRQMKKKGILFAVLPRVVISGKNSSIWRHEILKRHTLKSCIQFDKNLFAPVSEATYGLILQAHRPHEDLDEVFMGRLFDDKHRPRPSKVLSEYQSADNVSEMTSTLKAFMQGKYVEKSRAKEQAVITLSRGNELSNWLPESYIESGISEVNPVYAADRLFESTAVRRMVSLRARRTKTTSTRAKLGTFKVKDFVSFESKVGIKRVKDYGSGNIPVVGSSAEANGVIDWCNVPKNLCTKRCITISARHNTKPCEAFWHPYKFAPIANNPIVFRPINDLLEDEMAIIYFCEAINIKNSWRYNYANTPSLCDLEVDIPIKKNGKPDFKAMAEIVRRTIKG